MAEWINVKDRLPEETGRYIVHFENGEITDRNFWGDEPERFVIMTTAGRVTHWMPLPERFGNHEILAVPDVDAVRVVRCKDCRKYDLKNQCCTFWPDGGYRAPDHYCAEGERRSDYAAKKEKPHAGED